MRFSYGRVAFFLIFGVCKIRARFGGVLGGSGRGFLRHFGPDLVDFEGSERSQISSSKLESPFRKRLEPLGGEVCLAQPSLSLELQTAVENDR